jgi:hypothetical protein
MAGRNHYRKSETFRQGGTAILSFNCQHGVPAPFFGDQMATTITRSITRSGKASPELARCLLYWTRLWDVLLAWIHVAGDEKKFCC